MDHVIDAGRNDPDSVADAIRQQVNRHADALIGLSHRIHDHPETAFEEHRASSWLADVLHSSGFTVSGAVAGMDTAFVATAGDGPLHIALCAEYDALPGIGHACGHNVIAASSVGAALALAAVADTIGATVTVIGCPAEEYGGGKIRLLDAGIFDPIHAALMVHPSPYDDPAPRTTALSAFGVSYQGVAAHAGAFPERGVNAQDAMTVAQVALGLMRQQLPEGRQVHGIVTSGGDAPNIIPALAAGRFMARSATLDELGSLRLRVDDCFQAGAIASGAQLDLRDEFPPYAELRHHAGLTTLYRDSATALGRRFDDSVPRSRTGPSTDMGNVSHRLPAIHPLIGLDARGAVPHHPDFTAVAAGPSADSAVLDGALALSGTVIRLAALPDPYAFLGNQAPRNISQS
ncbi:M20 family metallopeptidase [Micromonospora sp. NBC_00617]|uniref:M20 family metallopeptidase n=1 Tax=Micromonospora sp. NBC_00617 TaxID=2903587 RepID=UPI0030E24CD1